MMHRIWYYVRLRIVEVMAERALRKAEAYRARAVALSVLRDKFVDIIVSRAPKYRRGE